jgi:hypothetical protein
LTASAPPFSGDVIRKSYQNSVLENADGYAKSKAP